MWTPAGAKTQPATGGVSGSPPLTPCSRAADLGTTLPGPSTEDAFVAAGWEEGAFAEDRPSGPRTLGC